MATTHLPVVGGHTQGPATTCRTDVWWAGPAATFAFLTFALGYMTWAAFQAEHYWVHAYLSPAYSPVIWTNLAATGAAPLTHAWFGDWPSFWPAFLPASPAIVILAIPASLRFTCYYYRKAYYRSFAGSPPGCWVNPVTDRPYRGETALMVFQNLHRYALYLALVYNVILFYDAFIAFFKGGDVGSELGIGVGSIVLLINASLLCGYSFGCHSFRHIIGGHDDCMSCDGKGSLRYSGWKFATWFNEHHMQFAWVSLGWVCFTDFYIRMVSMGVFTDLNTWG
jgi:hypothetical protein